MEKRFMTIKILYPEVILILALSTIPPAIILTYLSAVKRRNVLRMIRVVDSPIWYFLQALKILSLSLIIIASGVPVNTYMVVKELDVGVAGRKLQDITVNLTALHVFLIDESYSMNYTDGFNITRFELAIRFVENCLNMLNDNDKVLLIGFAKEPRLVCYGNVSQCRVMLREFSPSRRYTDIAGALSYAYTYVEASQMPALIVVVTDAAYNYGGNPYEAIVMVNKTGYPVIFVKVGFDNRGDRLVSDLVSSGIKVLYVNPNVIESVEQSRLNEIIKNTIRELRGEAFIRRRFITMNLQVEEKDISPTLFLVSIALIIFLLTRLEGY
ncbi:MAG: VWA domain-containing protein [Desulfurococcaceae archaeon]